MRLNEIADNAGARKRRMRVGRGIGSGKGKTSGRGVKGQKSRTGVAIKGFEGGQMPLYRRIPKRGFLPHGGKTEYAVVNLKSLAALGDANVVDPDALVAAGLIRKSSRDLVKLLGEGDVERAFTVKLHAVSESARAKIEARGGRVELLGDAGAAGA
jgi:large subunit ribosomal protein L15